MRSRRSAQLTHELGLSGRWDCSVVNEGGHHAFVAEVLAPSLKLLLRELQVKGKLHQGLSETVRTVVAQARSFEGDLEDLSDLSRA